MRVGFCATRGAMITHIGTEEAARQVIINSLGVLNDYLGDLDRISKIVKLLGFVNSADGFVEQPYVMNGASDLLEKVFGEKGKQVLRYLGM